MELNFTNNNGMYEAEFAASDAFNLNLVREKKGLISIFLKGASDGEYPTKASYRDIKAASVVDVDITAAAYPKYIKIVSSSPVVKGTVTTDGEAIEIPSGGQGGGFTIKSYTKSITFEDPVDETTVSKSPDELGWYSISVVRPGFEGYVRLNDPNIIILDVKALGYDRYGLLVPISELKIEYCDSTSIMVSAFSESTGGASPIVMLKLSEIV